MTPDELVAAGVALVGVALAVLARRWDGLGVVAWLTVVSVVLAPPSSAVAWGLWSVVGLAGVVTVVRRPSWLPRADRLAWAVLLAGGFVAAWVAGLPPAAAVAVGALGSVGLVAASVDRKGGAWRTRWVGEIPVREVKKGPGAPSDG